MNGAGCRIAIVHPGYRDGVTSFRLGEKKKKKNYVSTAVTQKLTQDDIPRNIMSLWTDSCACILLSSLLISSNINSSQFAVWFSNRNRPHRPSEDLDSDWRMRPANEDKEVEYVLEVAHGVQSRGTFGCPSVEGFRGNDTEWFVNKEGCR